jgi:hypothetical protein
MQPLAGVKHVIRRPEVAVRRHLVGFVGSGIAIRRHAITPRDYDIVVTGPRLGLFVLFDLANRSEDEVIVTKPGWT